MTTSNCPQCGSVLPSGAAPGICPKCLMQFGLGGNVGSYYNSTQAYQPSNLPPLPEELAPLFPQLEILEQIGHGGMGVVYKAKQIDLDRIVALKILRRDFSQIPGFANRFQREAQAMARLNHPNIITIFDFGKKEDVFYFIMEFVDGANLRTLEQRGLITPAQALTIIPQVCEALQYAHTEGVVHRDIKPENIMLSKTGLIKMADFGLAKLANLTEGERITGTRDVMGTPHYMAPEQVERPTAVDHRADIYSLGVVLYEMLTGELPLGRFPLPSKQRVGIDVRLDEVVLRSLEKEPARRYQSATEVRTVVDKIRETIGGSDTDPFHWPRLGLKYGGATSIILGFLISFLNQRSEFAFVVMINSILVGVSSYVTALTLHRRREWWTPWVACCVGSLPLSPFNLVLSPLGIWTMVLMWLEQSKDDFPSSKVPKPAPSTVPQSTVPPSSVPSPAPASSISGSPEETPTQESSSILVSIGDQASKAGRVVGEKIGSLGKNMIQAIQGVPTMVSSIQQSRLTQVGFGFLVTTFSWGVYVVALSSLLFVFNEEHLRYNYVRNDEIQAWRIGFLISVSAVMGITGAIMLVRQAIRRYRSIHPPILGPSESLLTFSLIEVLLAGVTIVASPLVWSHNESTISPQELAAFHLVHAAALGLCGILLRGRWTAPLGKMLAGLILVAAPIIPTVYILTHRLLPDAWTAVLSTYLMLPLGLWTLFSTTRLQNQENKDRETKSMTAVDNQ